MSQEIDEVGKTAFIIAEWREEESERPAPRFVDHLAHLFSQPETHRLAATIGAASPGTKQLIHCRTRCFDSLFLAEVRRGVRQIVILGAGLDTRSLRLAEDGVTVFEVDREEVLAFKKARLEAAGYALRDRVAVACDYTAGDFLAVLERRGLDPALPVFCLWEGNTMYLSVADIERVLCTLRDRLDAVTITFDYVSRRLVERATGKRGADGLVDGFGELGAPWLSGFDSIAEMAAKTRLELVEEELIVDLARRFDPAIRLDRDLFCDYSICTLSNHQRGVER